MASMRQTYCVPASARSQHPHEQPATGFKQQPRRTADGSGMLPFHGIDTESATYTPAGGTVQPTSKVNRPVQLHERLKTGNSSIAENLSRHECGSSVRNSAERRYSVRHFPPQPK
jgi:hypothetical protein